MTVTLINMTNINKNMQLYEKKKTLLVAVDLYSKCHMC